MSENLKELLLAELREAMAVRVGADPDKMTAELARRLHWIRQRLEGLSSAP